MPGPRCVTEQQQSTKSDPWQIWFSRIVQIVGLGAFIEQLIVSQGSPDRPWVLFISLAMMLGGLGMQMLLRAIARIAAEP